MLSGKKGADVCSYDNWKLLDIWNIVQTIFTYYILSVKLQCYMNSVRDNVDRIKDIRAHVRQKMAGKGDFIYSKYDCCFDWLEAQWNYLNVLSYS